MSATTTHASNTTYTARLSPSHTPEAHHRAADVSAALAAGKIQDLGSTPLCYLPLYAQIAIERLDRDASLRDGARLDELLNGYARSMCRTVDLETCAAAHRVCARRFHDFRETIAGAPWANH
jgi:hypothetical protein